MMRWFRNWRDRKGPMYEPQIIPEPAWSPETMRKLLEIPPLPESLMQEIVVEDERHFEEVLKYGT